MSTIILIGIVWLLMINTATVEPKEWSDYLLMGSHKYKMGSPKNMSKPYINTKEIINPWRGVKDDWIKNQQSVNFYSHRKQPLTIEKSASKPIVSLALDSKALSRTLKIEDNDLYMKKHKRRCHTGYYNFKLDLCEQRPLKLKSFIRSGFSSRNKMMLDNNKDMSFTKMAHIYMRPNEKAKNQKSKFSFQWRKDNEYQANPAIRIENSPQNEIHEEGHAYHESSSRLQPDKNSRTNFKSPYDISDEQESIFKDSSNIHAGNRLKNVNYIVLDDGTYTGNELHSPHIRKDISKASYINPSKEYIIDYDSAPIMIPQHNKNHDIKDSLLFSSGRQYKLLNIDALRKSKNSKFLPKYPDYYYNYKNNNQKYIQYKGQPNNYNYANRRQTQEKFNRLHNFGYGALKYREKGILRNKENTETENKNLLHQYVNEIRAVNHKDKFNVLENKIMYKDRHSPGGEHEGTIAGKLITGLLHSNGTLSIPALNGLSENQITEGLVEGPMTPAYDDTYPDSMSFDYSPQDFDLSQPLVEGNKETNSNSSEKNENPNISNNLQIKYSEIGNKPGIQELTSDKQVHNYEAPHAQLSGDVSYVPRDGVKIRVKQFMGPNLSKLELEIPHDIPIFNQSSNIQEYETSYVATEENKNTSGNSEGEETNETTVFGDKGNTDFVAGYTEGISTENTTVFDNTSITEQMHSGVEVSNEPITELAQEPTENTTSTELRESNTENSSPLTIGSTDVYDIPLTNNVSTCSPTNKGNVNSSTHDKVYFVITGTLYGKKVSDKNITEASQKDMHISSDSGESKVTQNPNNTMMMVYENSVNNGITTPLTVHNEKNMPDKLKLSDSSNNKKSEKLSHTAFVSDLQQKKNLQRKKKLGSLLNFPVKHLSPHKSINSNKIKNILLLKSHIVQEKLRPFKQKKHTEKYIYEPTPIQGTINFNEAFPIDKNEILNVPLNSYLKSSVGLETEIKSVGINKIGMHKEKKFESIQKNELGSNAIKNTDTQVDKKNILNNMISSLRKCNENIGPSCNSGKDNIQSYKKENVIRLPRKNEYESTNNNLFRPMSHEMLNNNQKILDTKFDMTRQMTKYNSEENPKKNIKNLKQQTAAPFKFDPQLYYEIYDLGGRSVIKKEIQSNRTYEQEDTIKNPETHMIDINNETSKTFILELPHIFNELLKHVMNGKNVDSAIIKLEIEPISKESKGLNESLHKSSRVVLKFNNEIPNGNLEDQRNSSLNLVPQQTNISVDSGKQIISTISDKLSPIIRVADNGNTTQFHSYKSETLHAEKAFNHSKVMGKENKIKNSNKDRVAYIPPKKTVVNYGDHFHEFGEPLNIKVNVWPENQQPILKSNTESNHAVSTAKENKQYLSDIETKEHSTTNDLKRKMLPANTQLSSEKQGRCFHSSPQYISINIYPPLLPQHDRSNVNKGKPYNSPNDNSYNTQGEKQQIWRKRNILSMEESNPHDENVEAIINSNKRNALIDELNIDINKEKSIKYCLFQYLTQEDNTSSFIYLCLFYPPYTHYGIEEKGSKLPNILMKLALTSVKQHFTIINHSIIYFSCVGAGNISERSSSIGKYIKIIIMLSKVGFRQCKKIEDQTYTRNVREETIISPYEFKKIQVNNFNQGQLGLLIRDFFSTVHSNIKSSIIFSSQDGMRKSHIFKKKLIQGSEISHDITIYLRTFSKHLINILQENIVNEFPTQAFFQHGRKILQIQNEPRMKHLTHQTFLCPCQYSHEYMFAQDSPKLKLYFKHLPNGNQKPKFSNSNMKSRAVVSNNIYQAQVDNFTKKIYNKVNGLNNTYAVRKSYSQKKNNNPSNSNVTKFKSFHNKIVQNSNDRQFTKKLNFINGDILSKELGSRTFLLHNAFYMPVQGKTFEMNHSPKIVHQKHFCANFQTRSIQKPKCFFKHKSGIRHTTNTGIKDTRMKLKMNTISNGGHKIMKKHLKTNKNYTCSCHLNKWHNKRTRKKHQTSSNKHSKQISLVNKELSNPNLSMADANFIPVKNIYWRHRNMKQRANNNIFESSWKNEMIKNTTSDHPLNQHKSKDSQFNVPPRRTVKHNKKYRNIGERERIHNHIHIRKLHAFFDKPNINSNYSKYRRKIYQFPNTTQMKNFQCTHNLHLNSSTLNSVANNSQDTHFYENPNVTQFGNLFSDFEENNFTYLEKQILNCLDKTYVDDSVTLDNVMQNKNTSRLIKVDKMGMEAQNPCNHGMSILAEDLNEVLNTERADQPLLASKQSPLSRTMTNYININEWEKAHKCDLHVLPISRNKRSIKTSMDDQSFSKPEVQNDIEHKVTHVNKIMYHPGIVDFSENKIKSYYARYPSNVDYLRRLKHAYPYNHNRTSIHLKLLHGITAKKESLPMYKNVKINYSPKIHNQYEDTVLVRNSKRNVISSAESSAVNDSFASDAPNFLNNPIGIENKLLMNRGSDLTTELGKNWINNGNTRERICTNSYNCNPLKSEDKSSYVNMQPELEENNGNLFEIPFFEQSKQMQIERPDLRNDSTNIYFLGTGFRETNTQGNVLTFNPTFKTELQIPVQEESNQFGLGNFDALKQIGNTEGLKSFSDTYFTKYVPYFVNIPMVGTIPYDHAHNNAFMQLSSVTKQSWTTGNNQPTSKSATGTETLTTNTADTTSVQEVMNEVPIITEDTTATAKDADISTHLTKINSASFDYSSIIEPQSTSEITDSDSGTVTVQQVTAYSTNLINQNFTASEFDNENENSVGSESAIESVTFTSSPQSIETESVTINSQYTEMESSIGPESLSSLQTTELETFQESVTPLISSQVTETVQGLTVSGNLQSNETEPINLLGEKMQDTYTETEQEIDGIGKTSQFISQDISNTFPTEHSQVTSSLKNPTEPIIFSVLNENKMDITESNSTIMATIKPLLIKDDDLTIHYSSPQITTISSNVQKISTEQTFEEPEPAQNQTEETINNLGTPIHSVSHFQTAHTENNQAQISETEFISVTSQPTGSDSVYSIGYVPTDLNVLSTEISSTTQEAYRNATLISETPILKENEPSTHIGEVETPPVTQMHLSSNFEMNVTSHTNLALITLNHSEQSTRTNNSTIQHTDHCEIKDNACHCALSAVIDEFAILASTQPNFSSYLNHYQCKETSFKETQLMLSDFDIHTDVHNTTDNFVEGKLKTMHYGELLLKYSTNTSSDDANLTVLIGSNVEIECTRSIDIFSLGQGSISFNWKFSAADVFNENVGEPVSGQELSLQNISLKDEGTYTCEVQSEEQENDDIAQFSHQVSVVGLPLYIIKIKMTYLRSQQCDEDDLILVKQFNSMLTNLVCGEKCAIWIPDVKCVNEGNVSLQYITIFCEIKHIYEMIPSLNNIKCDIQCSSYLDTIFLVGVQHNLQYFLTIPVSYRSSNSMVNIVPVEKKFNITLLQGCGLGYGIYENLCVPCPPQFYGPSDTYQCKPCEKGTYQPQKGSELCIPCPHPFAATTCHILVQERYSYIAAICIFGILTLTTVCCCSIAIYLRCKQRKNKTVSESPVYFRYGNDSSFQQTETVPLLPAKEVNEYSELHSAVQIDDDEVKDDITIFMGENGEKLHSHIVSYHIASETDAMHNSPGMIKFKTRKRRPPLPPLDF